MRIPSRLARPPLTEAVFEVRFTPAHEGVGDLLPGLLFGTLGAFFSKVDSTPLGNIPREIRHRPELKYAASHKLQGNGEALLIGDFTAALSVTAYGGWTRFKTRALEVATALRDTGQVGAVDRYSLKYVNVLKSSTDDPLEAFRIQLDLAGRHMTWSGFILRFETLNDGFLSIVECNSITKPSKLHGTAFSIDTIREGSDVKDFWSNVDGRLEKAHAVLEGIFFDLLAPETVEALGPIWE